MASEAAKRGRGRPRVNSDRLFVKALVIMIVRHFQTVHELLTVLGQPTAEMMTLRELLSAQGRFPTRRTWERRLKAIPDTLPAQIGCLGRHLVSLIDPWQNTGRAVAMIAPFYEPEAVSGIKSTVSKASRLTLLSTRRLIAPRRAAWLDLGWKLHLVCAVAAVWIPLAATLTPANLSESDLAPELPRGLPAEVRFVLGGRHYNRDELGALGNQDGRCLMTTQYERSPHTDDGVEVRRTFHTLRSVAIENFHEHFKGIFDGHGQVPDLWLARYPMLCARGDLCLPTRLVVAF